MKMYVGITDHDWFKLLRQEKSMKLNQQENAHENVCRYYRS